MRRLCVCGWILVTLWGGLPASGAEIDRCRIQGIEGPGVLRLRCGPTLRQLRLRGIRLPRPGPPQLGGEPFAEEARDRIRQWLQGLPASIAPPSRHREGPAILLPTGEELIPELLRRGLAQVEGGGADSPSSGLLAAEREARSRGRGIWSHEAWRAHQEESTRAVVLPGTRAPIPRRPLADRARELSDESWEERKEAFEAAMRELEGPDAAGSDPRED